MIQSIKFCKTPSKWIGNKFSILITDFEDLLDFADYAPHLAIPRCL